MKNFLLILALVCVAALCGCSPVKHVPEGKYLLDKVDITIEDPESNIKKDELINFLRQHPNHKTLKLGKLQLGTYNLSGKDTSRWYNRWLRKIGEPPVIFSPELTTLSARQLRQAMINRGYMGATVTVDSALRADKRRASLRYRINPGQPHVVSTTRYEVGDSVIADIIMGDTTLLKMRRGSLLDRNELDNTRERVAERLRNDGYYLFTKDDIRFFVDTIAGSHDVDLTMVLRNPVFTPLADGDSVSTYTRYYIDRVIFVTDYDPAIDGSDNFRFADRDTVQFKDITVLYGPDRYIRPSILEEKCYIHPGSVYSSREVDRTYEALNQLGILKFINITMQPVGYVDGRMMLNAYILLSRNKKQSVTVEVEGTHSEGDFGFGVGLTYQHRNLAHGAEQLTAKLRGSYESISGKWEDLINNHYTELAAEVGITFPKFEAPFLSKSFKQRMRAVTEFSVSGNYQERPEYTRVIFGAAWKYRWNFKRRDFNNRHTYDLIDVNYVRLPRSTINFLDSIAPSNPLLRYSYEDHFIMRMGYTFFHSNRRTPSTTFNALQPSITTFRMSVETAGNLLYAISSIFGQHRSNGTYKVFGIQYSQYAKAEVDYTYTRTFNSRNALAVHAAAGIAVPYGNSSMVPFEKRFYAGGASGVRGWNVRSLGPGSYNSRNSVTDFINQCGDIRLAMNLEYRVKIWWFFEGAVFVDAGNIWTIHNYVNQPGGMFKFNKFYKQIAASYGAGIRCDCSYFILRFDLGIKAHNPAEGQEPWPLIHPRWGRDTTFHFTIGYPF